MSRQLQTAEERAVNIAIHVERKTRCIAVIGRAILVYSAMAELRIYLIVVERAAIIEAEHGSVVHLLGGPLLVQTSRKSNTFVGFEQVARLCLLSR